MRSNGRATFDFVNRPSIVRSVSCPASQRSLLRHQPITRALTADELIRHGISSEDAFKIVSKNSATLDDVTTSTFISNVAFLRTIYRPNVVAKLLHKQPELFRTSLAEWYKFLTGYGLSDEDVWKALRYGPRLVLRQPAAAGANADSTMVTASVNTPYNAGAGIVFLKSYGWTDEDIVRRVLPCYPEVLAATPEQLQAAVDFLRSRSFDDEAIRRMIRTFPQLLVGSFNEGLFELIDRIRASAHNKYVVSGSYHV